MPIADKLDEYGKGAWLALTLLGFWICWPVGLAMVLFIVASGRARAWRCASASSRGAWHYAERHRGGGGCGWGGWGRHQAPSSGNAAFDEYRHETLKRLEEEYKEFVEYLDRLRAAKDKQEFDQFMAERRDRQTPQTT